MALHNSERSIPAALGLALLSVCMASLMTIAIPHNTNAQELPEGSETQQSGEQVPGTSQPDTGIASLDDTTAEQPGGGAESSPCTPAQTGGAGVQNSTANATTTTTTTTIGGSGSMTNNNNTTMSGADEVNPSTSQVRDHIEQACIALEVGDTEGALRHLNFALGELGGGSDDIQGNNTATSLSEGEEGSFNEGTSVGGTGPFDDYDATPDAEAG